MDKTILLVEDNPDDEILTRRALEKNDIGSDVVVARDGAEALNYLFGEGAYEGRDVSDIPRVVLLDLKLPKVDGIEVLTQVKSDPELKFIPIVMLTSSREERDLANSYGLGVNAYVVKPVAFPDFVMALKELGLFWAVVNQPPPGGPGKEARK